MNQALKTRLQRGAALATSAYLFTPMAFAQSTSDTAAVDVTSVVTKIQNQMSSIVLVGGAVLAIFVGVKAFKWVRGALS